MSVYFAKMFATAFYQLFEAPQLINHLLLHRNL